MPELTLPSGDKPKWESILPKQSDPVPVPQDEAAMQMVALREGGMSKAEIARRFGVSMYSVSTWLKCFEQEATPISALKVRLGKAGMVVSAKALSALNDRLDDPDHKWSDGALTVLHGVAAQRARETLESVPTKIDEPDWDAIEI